MLRLQVAASKTINVKATGKKYFESECFIFIKNSLSLMQSLKKENVPKLRVSLTLYIDIQVRFWSYPGVTKETPLKQMSVY